MTHNKETTMDPKYTEGEKNIYTLYSEAAEIIGVNQFGGSFFYTCVVAGRGSVIIHETKLIKKGVK
jgi:hypothetical protein